MASKDQKRGNRELKKPKKKPATAVEAITPPKAGVAVPQRALKKS